MYARKDYEPWKSYFACILDEHRSKVFQGCMYTQGCQNDQNPSVVLEPRLVCEYLMQNSVENRFQLPAQGTRRVHGEDSMSPSENATNSASQFVHSTSWPGRVQNFDFCCQKWNRNITLNCFGIIKLVLDGVMVVLIHLQRLISIFHDYMCSYVLETLI